MKGSEVRMAKLAAASGFILTSISRSKERLETFEKN
jgi:hypothetical protein